MTGGEAVAVLVVRVWHARTDLPARIGAASTEIDLTVSTADYFDRQENASSRACQQQLSFVVCSFVSRLQNQARRGRQRDKPFGRSGRLTFTFNKVIGKGICAAVPEARSQSSA